MIATDILDPNEEVGYGVVDDDGAILDEDDKSGLGEVGVSTVVTKAGTKEVDAVHQAVKADSIPSHMLKPPYFLTQVFKWNNKASDNIFKHMCEFGARSEWRNGRRATSYYLDIETIKYQDFSDQSKPFGMHHR